MLMAPSTVAATCSMSVHIQTVVVVEEENVFNRVAEREKSGDTQDHMQHEHVDLQCLSNTSGIPSAAALTPSESYNNHPTAVPSLLLARFFLASCHPCLASLDKHQHN